LVNISGWRGRLGWRLNKDGAAALCTATAFTGTNGPVTGIIGAIWSLSGVVEAQADRRMAENKIAPIILIALHPKSTIGNPSGGRLQTLVQCNITTSHESCFYVL
jgi:hypothetical protein